MTRFLPFAAALLVPVQAWSAPPTFPITIEGEVCIDAAPFCDPAYTWWLFEDGTFADEEDSGWWTWNPVTRRLRLDYDVPEATVFIGDVSGGCVSGRWTLMTAPWSGTWSGCAVP